MFPACLPGEIKRHTMYLRRIPPRMRIKQAAWKSSVGVRVLLVWQRDCHHIKIAWVLNKTETCTIYTCQRERERERQHRPDMGNFHSHISAAWCEVQVLALHVRLNFMKWHLQHVHMTEVLWMLFLGWWDKSFVYSSTCIMSHRQSFEQRTLWSWTEISECLNNLTK